MILPLFLLTKASFRLPFRLFYQWPLATLCIWQVKSISFSLLKSAPFCMLFAVFYSSNKSATSIFLLSKLCYNFLVSVLISIQPSLVHLAGTILHLLPLCYWVTMVFCQPFLSGNDTADEVARRGALLQPHTFSCSLFSFSFRIH